jgi:arginyl-tRNA synthetase
MFLKKQLIELFGAALGQLTREGVIPATDPELVRFERTRQKEHGDLATNLALVLARPAGRKPRDLAAAIVAALPASAIISKVEIAGPGFINIFLRAAERFAVVGDVRAAGARYGCAQPRGERVLIEYVSANPTGPLHVGHGRGAAYGDALARVLRAAGFDVASEYYVNDAGRQMDILAVSVWLRYLELCGSEVRFPDNGYQGDYVYDIAAGVHRGHGDEYVQSSGGLGTVSADVEPEAAMDALIDHARGSLGAAGYRVMQAAAVDTLLEDIHNDLEQFNVNYDRWFSECSLFENGSIDDTVARLRDTGHLYQRDGAWWFRSSRFGDEKDRVVLRENGVPTYFAADIAYHRDKYSRGFDRFINVWGADHHGYIPRVKAAISALGLDPDRLTVTLVQFAVLYRAGEKVSMSTRSGEFVTLRELRQEVSSDAARFFYVQRKSDQHMDFDLDLAKSRSNDNPVYYVQYAHARVCSVFNQARERGIDTSDLDAADLGLLTDDHELELAAQLARFPEVVSAAAAGLEPHQIVYYLRELANGLHTYYNAHQFLTVAVSLRSARLALIDAVRQVLANGLDLVGVSAPERM